MQKIIYKPKKEFQPKFGLSVDDKVFIRDDLPYWVQMSVIVHELYHLNDKSKNKLGREIKAIMAQLFMPLIGGIWCIFLSLSIYRLKYYYYRIKEGRKA